MLVFGVDVPLIEIVFILAIILFFVLIEVIIIVSMLIKQTNKAKDLSMSIERLTEALLHVKKAEIQELNMLKRK